MISPTMHTRWHSVYVCVLCVWTVSIGGGILQLRIWTGGVFCNFGFGLRGKSWKFGLRGVFCNFGFGPRKKSWKFGLGGVF